MKTLKFVLVISILVLLYSCKSNDEKTSEVVEEIQIDFSETDFVYLSGKEFRLKNDKYFPIMLNYILSFRDIDGEFIVSPHIDYENIEIFETNTKEDIDQQLRAHFQLIKEMGFNSLRLCFDRLSSENSRHYYNADGVKYFLDTDHEKILNGLSRAIDIAEEKGLRVMLLIKPPLYSEELEKFTIDILQRFRDNPTVFSYDFMNEPLYFDYEPERKKEDVCRVVSVWKDLVKKNAPYQMFTIGFSEPIEVFKWDPFLLSVDFVAFHTYSPMRAKNEIYWYSTYINKPWMIGETGLPADNDSVPYEDQVVYTKNLFQYVLDCGGAGFGLWDFQEGNIPDYFEAQHTGLLNHEGFTITIEGDTIIGTVKPVTKIIPDLVNLVPNNKKRPVNYYNMMGYNNYLIKGKVYDQTIHQPVKGAVVRGWNEWWNVGMNTFTDENGEFTLYSNDECVHFEISAPGMSRIKFDDKLNYIDQTKGEYDRENLPDQMLEYHSISYKTLLKDHPDDPVFDFDPNKFNKSKFVGNMRTQYLIPIKCD